MSRQYYYAEDLTESTSTSTSYVDKLSLSFTPDASSTYFILGRWQAATTSTSNTYKVSSQMMRSGLTYNEYLFKAQNVGDYFCAGSLGIETFGASPTLQTYKIQYHINSTQTAKIKQAALIAIKATSNDKYVEALPRVTNSTTTPQAAATLTFTPGTTGNYLILACATVDESSTASYSAEVFLDVDGTPYGDSQTVGRAGLAADLWFWSAMKQVSLNATSHTITVKFNRLGGAVAGIQNVRIIALRLSDFDASYYADRAIDDFTSSSAFSTHASLNATPVNADHLVLAHGLKYADTASTPVYSRLVEAGTVQFTDPTSTGAIDIDYMHLWGFYVKTLSATSTTWTVQYASNGSATVDMTESSIAVLQLGNVSGGRSVSVSDTTTVTESIGRAISTSTRSVSDSASVAESVSVSVVTANSNSVSVSDAVTTTESLNLAQGLNSQAITDSVTVSESKTVSLQAPTDFNITVSDNVNSTESLSVAMTNLTINKSDSTSLTESLGSFRTSLSDIHVSDSVTPTDQVGVSEALQSFSDLVLTREQYSLSITSPGISKSDSVTVSESMTTQVDGPATLLVTATDTVFTTEFTPVSHFFNINRSDSTAVSEAVTMNESVAVQVFDIITSAEFTGMTGLLPPGPNFRVVVNFQRHSITVHMPLRTTVNFSPTPAPVVKLRSGGLTVKMATPTINVEMRPATPVVVRFL